MMRREEAAGWSTYELNVIEEWRNCIVRMAAEAGAGSETIARRLQHQCGDTAGEGAARQPFGPELWIRRVFGRLLSGERGAIAESQRKTVDLHDELALLSGALAGHDQNVWAYARSLLVRHLEVWPEAVDDFHVRRLRHALGIQLANETCLPVNRLYETAPTANVYIPKMNVVDASSRTVCTNLAGTEAFYLPHHETVDGAVVSGHGQIVNDGVLELNDPTSESASGFVAGWWALQSSYPLKQDSVTLHTRIPRPSGTLESAIVGIGRVAANYWHSLVEYIPAILHAIDRTGCNTVLWSQDAPSTATELLMCARNVELVMVPRSEWVEVKHAIVPVFGAASFDSPIRPPGDQCAFDPRVIKDSYTDLRFHSPRATTTDRKFFLLRGSTTKARTVTGIEEVIAQAKRDGYSIVDPGLLSWEAQASIFQHADHVVGFGGAVWANLLFARPGIRISSFVSRPMSIYLPHRYIARQLHIEFDTFVVEPSRNPHPWEAYSNYAHVGLALTLDDWHRATHSS